MHELSLMSSVVDEVKKSAKEHGFQKVEKIRLAVGALSGVEPSCLEFCFSEVTKGTVLEQAELLIELVPLLVFCPSCQNHFNPVEVYDLSCPSCHSIDIQVKKGREFRIIDLDVT